MVDELKSLLLPICSDKEDQLTDNVRDISAPMIPSRTSSRSTVLGNLSTTAVFSSVVWPGAFFVWFVYTFFQMTHIMLIILDLTFYRSPMKYSVQLILKLVHRKLKLMIDMCT